MEEKTLPSGLVFILSVGIAFFYGLLALLIGDLGGRGQLGGDATGFGYLGTCFFLSLITFALSFLPFSSHKYNRRVWWVVGGWVVITLIVLGVLVSRGYFYNPTGLG